MKRFCFPLLLMCGLFLFSGWGFLVHRTVNQLAVYQLPKGMRPFFHEHLDYLVQKSVRPDQRRNSDSTEAPKHFIDAEVYGDSALWRMPYNWQQAVAQYSKDTLEKYGYVPYWVMNVKAKLTNAFRNGNRDSVLYYAADLGHYIADAHVPLHTTINYDGQLTNQKGLHSLWESIIPELELKQYNLRSSHRATYLKNPENAIWHASRQGFVLLDDVFQQEKEASEEFTDSTKYRVQLRNGRQYRSYTTAFAKAYSKRLGNTINRQLLRSANLIADFWYTSWVDAGKPDLTKLLQEPRTKEESAQLRKEVKAYKKNELLKENLLLARKSKEKED